MDFTSPMLIKQEKNENILRQQDRDCNSVCLILRTFVGKLHGLLTNDHSVTEISSVILAHKRTKLVSPI